MFWIKKPKPTPWWKKLWMVIPVVFSFITGTGYSAYQFVQPDFHHLEEHLAVVGVLDAYGNIIVQADTDHLPNVATTVQLLVDGEHITHLHFPQGIPTEKGKSYAVGKEELIINGHISYQPAVGEVEVRFVFSGFPMLTTYVISAKTMLYYDGGQNEESNSSYRSNLRSPV